MPVAPSVIRAVAVVWVVAGLAAAQAPDGGSVAFRQACLDATTDALVLNVAAHPDDEADRTLVWLRHGRGVRTVTLYSTCGSGGQNAIGREIGPDLARIRVRETLAAARHTGVEVRWLGFPDFGYSKRTDETLEQWGGRQELERRLGAFVDELRPDVVITNHSPSRGHGHHRASAEGIRDVLAQRAEAGWVVPLYERTFGRRFLEAMGVRAGPDQTSSEDSEPPAEPDWECDPFELDPVRGMTHARLANRGRREHATQGPWRAHNPTSAARDRWMVVLPKGAAGDLTSHFGSLLEEPAFEAVWRELGFDLDALARDLDGFAADRAAREHVAAARRLLPRLRQAKALLPGDGEGAHAARRLARRVDALQRVVLAGSGVEVEVDLTSDRLLRGGSGTARVLVHAVEPGRVAHVAASCRGAHAVPLTDKETDGLRWRIEFAVGDGRHGSDGEALAPVPFEPEWIDVDVELEVDGLPLAFRRHLAADLADDLDLAWAVQTMFTPGRPVTRVLALRAHHDGAEDFDGRVELELPDAVEAEIAPSRVHLTAEHPSATVLIRLRVPAVAQPGDTTVRARLGGASSELRLVRTVITPDPELRIGLVRGPDDTLQRALENLGVVFELLDETTLAATDLSRFSTVVLDIRAYHHRPDLAQHRARLLEFCAAGGRIVSFYHKSGEWNAHDGHPLLAPFALQVGSQRVCEEAAEVKLLQPEHRLWTHPHRITTADFDGWVQERGLNFPSKWDDKWLPMIEMSDTGEDPLQSGLLFVTHGDGDFLYCSLALYRQLRVGHRGAARILMNLLTR